jgi:hypothetical protein
MSGNPTFQGNAFQNTAFQAGVSLVAANYWLGSPSFAAPAMAVRSALSALSYSLGPLDIATPGKIVYALAVNAYQLASPVFAKPGPLHFNYHFTAASWAVGSPTFGTPPLLAAGNLVPLTVNPYLLGSPSFVAPFVRQTNGLRVNAYFLSSPVFGTPVVGTNYRLYANASAIGSPAFDAPRLGLNYQFLIDPYWLGSPDFALAGPFHVNYVLTVNPYSLGSPTFAYPRLQWQVVDLGLPLTYFTDAETATNVLQTLCNYLLGSLPPSSTSATITARRLTANLRDHADEAIRGSTLGTQLQQVYLACDAAGATYAGVDAASLYLFSQALSTSVLTQILFHSALVMNLGLETKIISRTTFENQEEIQNMMAHVRALFEAAKRIGIDDVDVTVYQALIAMGGSIMNHLNYTELQLPRYMTYVSNDVMPSLYLANRIYADASRSDEIENENGVIHPAFVPRQIRVLSNVGM